ncbi:HIRAN domain-containing protein [Sphingomonas sp. LB2R24]|uniref:HIRAN domain-containing protein n=1 Tax=Sphingomonas sorbitolis TaxID=3096165 RepID=UPI002FCBB8ED
MQEFSLAVVGIKYPNKDKSNRRYEAMLCVPGDEVHLVPEPKNKHDARAVAVVTDRGTQIGYLSAERCGWIGGRIAAGEICHAIFQALDTYTATIRIRFGGESPTLPGARRQPKVWDEYCQLPPEDWAT